jgi:hypothetical protein
LSPASGFLDPFISQKSSSLTPSKVFAYYFLCLEGTSDRFQLLDHYGSSNFSQSIPDTSLPPHLTPCQPVKSLEFFTHTPHSVCCIFLFKVWSSSVIKFHEHRENFIVFAILDQTSKIDERRIFSK